MTVRKFQIPSFGAPSGVTFITNILLELGIYTYNLPMGHWYDLGKEEILTNTHQFRNRDGSMPFFFKHDFPPFAEDIEVGWSHQWPSAEYLHLPTILRYRNVKGALYSQFKRKDQSGTRRISRGFPLFAIPVPGAESHRRMDYLPSALARTDSKGKDPRLAIRSS